jgi:NAD(P)-dependent dehydrogenase (short-subunit alcohol dehydrogenase family)
MTQDLAGKTLVVTGAARGIGEQVAQLAVGRGAQVALIGLEPERLRSLATELGPTTSFVEADVRDGAALRAAMDASAESLGGIDYVVTHSSVLEAAVIGVPDATWGEVVAAYVQPRPGHVVDAGALKTLCAQRLSGYERPVQYVVVEALATNAVGKIDKVSLRGAHDEKRHAPS